MNTQQDIEKILLKHKGLSQLELSLALLTARVETLQTTLLKAHYKEGSDEMRAAYDQSQKLFMEFLEIELDRAAPLGQVPAPQS